MDKAKIKYDSPLLNSKKDFFHNSLHPHKKMSKHDTGN